MSNEINIVTISGGVGQDPTFYSYGDNKELGKFSVGNRQPAKEGFSTHWFNCVGFDKGVVESIHSLQKGSKVVVTGTLQTSSYENKEGVTVRAVQILVNHVAAALAGPAREEEEEEAPRKAVAPRAKVTTTAAKGKRQPEEDTEPPF